MVTYSFLQMFSNVLAFLASRCTWYLLLSGWTLRSVLKNKFLCVKTMDLFWYNVIIIVTNCSCTRQLCELFLVLKWAVSIYLMVLQLHVAFIISFEYTIFDVRVMPSWSNKKRCCEATICSAESQRCSSRFGIVDAGLQLLLLCHIV